MEPVLIEKAQHEITPDLALLDASEMTRYQRLLLPQKQLEFLTGRTFLKSCLAEYLGKQADQISILIGHNGKPYLSPLTFPYPMDFNLTHSDGRYLVGISAFSIGVDVEKIQPTKLPLYRHFLTDDEFRTLCNSPEISQTSLFYQLFTLKEALIKATNKKWPLHEIAFDLSGSKWILKSPDLLFQFYQWENAGYASAVCIHSDF